jgi:hypothetical protein
MPMSDLLAACSDAGVRTAMIPRGNQVFHGNGENADNGPSTAATLLVFLPAAAGTGFIPSDFATRGGPRRVVVLGQFIIEFIDVLIGERTSAGSQRLSQSPKFVYTSHGHE